MILNMLADIEIKGICGLKGNYVGEKSWRNYMLSHLYGNLDVSFLHVFICSSVYASLIIMTLEKLTTTVLGGHY